MSQILDILGSFITGATIILVVMNLNFQITTSQRENFFSSISQTEVVNFANIFENDIYKIGYQTSTANIITSADSVAIQFYADIDNDTTAEQVYYTMGATTALAGTTNPNDRPVYRRIGTGNTDLIGTAYSMQISYFDSIGNQLQYSALSSSQSTRNRIKKIGINYVFETPYPVDGKYQRVQWKKFINPRNLN
ncbi:MAG: hypothetical protein M0Q21_13100 [Ignavibacteriaceae bacterium]|jgi:hypothetical protein|nr:hypothetical protein [Ignavibacteriaceae bacterium]